MKLAILAAAVALLVLARRSWLSDGGPAPTPEPDELVPMAAWGEADGMCPRCVTPWKCNGPHLIEETDWYRQQAAAGRT